MISKQEDLHSFFVHRHIESPTCACHFDVGRSHWDGDIMIE